MKHMIGCAAILVAAVVVAVTDIDLPGWALYAVVLACPLMMLAMMRAMSDNRGAAGDGTRSGRRRERLP